MSVQSQERVSLESVELSFKDQYVGRADLWHLSNGLVGSCVYTAMQVSLGNIRAKVQQQSTNGALTASTLAA
jgi:DEP domain-containing protein 5